jgi:hypothetical protein
VNAHRRDEKYIVINLNGKYHLEELIIFKKKFKEIRTKDGGEIQVVQDKDMYPVVDRVSKLQISCVVITCQVGGLDLM